MCICLWKLTWQWLKVNANGKLCCESTRRREPVRHFDEHKKYFYLLKSQRGCKSTWQNLSRLMLSITLTSFIPTLKFFRPFKKLVTGYFWYFCKLSKTCFGPKPLGLAIASLIWVWARGGVELNRTDFELIFIELFEYFWIEWNTF